MRVLGSALGLGAIAALGLLQIGCNIDAYCFDCSSGAGGKATSATSSSSGEGGGIGLDAGNGSGGGGGISVGCNTDTMTDPKNCGFCGNVCVIPNAFPVCEGGFCKIDKCAPGWLDHDGMVTDGCEYQCTVTNSGVEACDGLDNDCNTLVDELTDKQNDPFNCGACNKVCQYSNAIPVCQMGSCAMGPCLVGYVDLDMQDGDGCEYQCTVTNGGVEVCDYADNNCDGQIDEGFDTQTDPLNCGTCGNDCSGVFANSQPDCVGGVCQFGPCLPGYYNKDGIDANGCEYQCTLTNNGVEICDGLDNDCNGGIDDGVLPGVGAPCGQSNVGACKFGVQQCVGGGLTCVGAVGPSPDLCDGIDNDCDGQVDQGCPSVHATDIRLDVGANSGVNQAPSTQLSVASRGNIIFAAYLDRRSGNSDIRGNVSQDGGLTWLAASDLAVATTANNEVEPMVIPGKTNAYVSFGQFNGTNRDVYLARAVPPFSAFTSVRADKDATGADAFFIKGVVAQQGAADAIVIVWESLSGSGANVTTDVFVQSSIDNGVTWKAADKRVNAVAGVAELPVVATDGSGHAFIAWRDNRGGNAEVYFDVYDATTGNLAGNKSLSAGHPAEDITIAADAGGPNVYVAWTDLRAAKKAIRVNRSINAGGAFDADGQIVNPDSTFADASTPAIACRSGSVVVAWEDTRSGLPDIRVNQSINAGGTWAAQTSRVDLGDTPGVGASTRPSVALGSGNKVYVTWEDARSGQRDIYANHSLDLGVTFQPKDLRLDVGMAGAPSPAGGADSRSPFMLTDMTGTRGVAVWIDYRTAAGVTGVNADIYANYFQ